MSSGRRVLWVDATAGASGDMILGALVDLGVPLARVRRALESLPVSGWTLSSRKIRRAALAARKVNVKVRGHQHGRGWRELKRILSGGDLERAVRDRALSIFRRLIEAEAEVHGTPPEKVHLHEAGGTDAIVDVVGACVGLAHLAPERIVVSPMTTGAGTVRCEHGVYPVPAPATALLIRGAPVRAGEIEVERLTPTGAAILTSVADTWGALPMMRPLAAGYGAGDRDLGDDPNLLRMILGEEEHIPTTAGSGERGEVVVVEFATDDATPQLLAYTVERLFEVGALDVQAAPALMKKGRPGHHVTVLARPAAMPEVCDVILRETTSLGLRYRTESRIELQRSTRRVRTRYGAVTVKVGHLPGNDVKVWPEYENCASLARKHNVPLREVQQAALQAFNAREDRPAARERKTRPGNQRRRRR